MASYPDTIANFPTWVTGDDINASNQNDPNDEITAVETGLLQGFTHNVQAPGFRYDDASDYTLASGAITITNGYLSVDTEGAAATDDLDTITIGVMADGVAIGEGSIIVLQIADNTRTVTAKTAIGNLVLRGDFVFTDTSARLTLLYDGTDWVELSRQCTPPVQSVIASGSPPNSPAVTPLVDAYTQVDIDARVNFSILTPTPAVTVFDGQKLVIRIKDDGTSKTITYDAIYRAIGVTLPTATVSSKTLYLGMLWNATDSKWDVVAVGQEV